MNKSVNMMPLRAMSQYLKKITNAVSKLDTDELDAVLAIDTPFSPYFSYTRREMYKWYMLLVLPSPIRRVKSFLPFY